MNPIRSWLYIGKYRETLNPNLLATNHIQAMLQLADPVEQPGIVSLFIPVKDDEPILPSFFEKGVAFARDQKRLGKRVLVACGAGINRSSAFAIAILKEEEGCSLLDAFQEVKRLHPEAMLHHPVWDSLCKYYAEEIPYSSLTPGISSDQLEA
jgi:protein-tyrosine phosphatase